MTTINSDSLIINKPSVVNTGKCNKFINDETGKVFYKPTDTKYYNIFYHANKKTIECSICGKLIVSKIKEHQRTNKCRLINFMKQEELKKLENEKEQ